jgi:terminase small subunit|nr:MAG TPA: terminase small subunit [Caudoviricetes sp.]DAT02969.1 MAG TPA: terminase small subunit [Caudoviricetes sp.]
MSSRKIRSDSTTAKVLANDAAQRKLEPPQKLTKAESRYWESITTSRNPDSWTPIDKERAVKLAKLYVELDDYENELATTARRWIKTDNGVMKQHPLHYVIEDLYKREIQMCRSLQIHSRATNGESRDQVKTNQLYQDARNAIDDEDGLIATRVIN